MKNLKVENHNTIFQEERLEQIMALLERDSRLVTNDLPAKFNTTSVTIRKDLIILEKRGLLKRTHGGAIKVNNLYPGQTLPEKEKINLDEKIRIVKQAARLISEGDTIILDSGSTTSLLAKEIKFKHGLTVITNAINIANELLQSDIEVILIGGSLLKETSTLVGPIADDSLQKLSAGKLFIGVDGIDFERGLTTPNLQEAKTSSVMMEISSEIILLADSSKFGRRSLGVISPVKDIDAIITTRKLTDEEQRRLSHDGIEVFMV